MNRRLAIILLPFSILLSGCASYQYAKDVKFVSFDGNLAPGTGIGPVRGESCQAFVMGYPIGEAPTLDKAVADAEEQHKLRYMSNMSTDVDGLNAVVYVRNCVVVKGTGYQ
jgi:hypothetical protein